jgi:hypothetical protein
MSDQSSDGNPRRKFLFDMGIIAATLAAPAVLADTGKSAKRKGPPKKVGMGVVGGGFGRMFQWHLHPQSHVVAVCEKRDDRLEVLKTTYRCNTGFKEYSKFLEHPGLDAVALFTPAPFHVKMAVEALRRGKHVISAVPAGLSVEELEELLSVVKETGLKYMMAETSRYRPEVQTCIDLQKEGKFGEIFYTEAEYHHPGSAGVYAYGPSFDCQSCEIEIPGDKPHAPEKDLSKLVPTWAYAYPPMLYPTHCTGLIIPVTGERFTEVMANGWGDGSKMLQKNYYNDNPFFHTVALFKTSKGHSSRISIGWHLASGGTERALFYSDRLSYIMSRPEGSPNTIIEQKANSGTPYGIYAGDVESKTDQPRDYLERLPEALRIPSGHGGSHTFITHEFISAIVEDRHPAVNIWEAIAYTMPGVIAHQSALAGGSCLKIKDYGTAPA